MIFSPVYVAPSQPPMCLWAPPPMGQQNGIIIRYTVNITSVDGGDSVITYSQTTTTLLRNFHPFTTYDCSVSAETVAPGPFSPAVVILRW